MYMLYTQLFSSEVFSLTCATLGSSASTMRTLYEPTKPEGVILNEWSCEV